MYGAVRILGRAMVGALALVLVLSLLSYHPSDPHLFASGAVAPAIRNWCGGFGALLAGLFHTLVGYGAFLIPCYIVWEVWPVKESRWVRRLAWYALAFALWTTLGAFGRRTWPAVDGLSAMETRIGGWFGDVLWPFFYKGLGPAGYPVLFGALVLVCLVVLAPVLTRALGRLMIRWFGEKAWPWLKPIPAKGFQSALGMTKRAFLKAPPPVPELSARDFEGLTAQEPENDGVEALARAEREAAAFRKSGKHLAPEVGLPAIQSMRLPTPSEELPPIPSMRLSTPVFPVSGDLDLDLDDVITLERYETPAVPLPAPAVLRDVPPPPPPKPLLVAPRLGRDAEGRRVEQQVLGLTEPTPHAVPAFTPAPRPAPAKPTAVAEAMAPVDRLELPPRRLFDPPHAEARLNPAILEETRALVQQKLTEFKVKGSVVGMQPGPVVTVYEFQPDPGVPLAKVMNMEDDLALGLQAEKVRIDRIPGRNLVGIEVPNPKRETITFREIVDSPAFRDPSHKDGQSLLTLALGKDIAGKPVVFDLAKMPHLLIGGSTGSGKSVGVNAMICSILLRAMPDEVKLILVDPKMVEMGIYEDIPHLWAPVVTDMKEAGRVLKWVVAQMEDRYRRLALLSVRNLEGFNQKVVEAGGSIDLSDRTPNPRWPERPLCLEPLPYVVVVIDELADLMMVARAEVEESIARIAQKARAVGIHLVLATQRPSVDIVTGVIKANLPSRLSYRVNTKIDSRTILDTGGGEQLLGKGDALFLAPGQARPHRIHAPFLTEEETLRLVNWLKERGKPDYNRQLLLAMETEEELPGNGGAEDVSGAGEDDIYARACAVVKRERKASTSLLQRKLNLGYGRAARIIDRMEEEGLIGSDRGAGKPREVYAPEE